MASFNIHLSIAHKYIEKNNIKEKNDFLRGSIAPDLEKDDKKSHYCGYRNKNDIINNLENKVLLINYLKENEIKNIYDRGVFLHLITDYLFFNTFFEKDYLLKITYEDFCKDLYYSYSHTNKYLKEKYKIEDEKYCKEIEDNIKKDQQEKNMDDSIRRNILPYKKLDEFIEKVSNINLNQYKKEILKAGKNILPESFLQ